MLEKTSSQLVVQSDLCFSASRLRFVQPSQAPSLLPPFAEPSFRVPSRGALTEHLPCARREALEVDGTVCDFKELPNWSLHEAFPSLAVRMAAAFPAAAPCSTGG